MRQRCACLLAFVLAGCSLAPPYSRPAAPVPSSWPVGDAYLTQLEQGLPTFTYSHVFADPRLQAVIGQALANNRDVRVAAANIADARARVRAARSDQLPSIDASGSANVRSGGGSDTSQSYSLEAGVSGFELDLFGRLRNATAAERERELSTEAAARTVRLALVADVATTWATYAADTDLLAIAHDTADNAGRAVQLTRLRLEGGIAPRTDLRQAEQVLNTAQADVAQQTAAVAQDINQLQLLVGAPVDPALLPDTLAQVLASTATLPAGTSSDVLLRRPDVLRAEYLLRAANANIGVARAALFPRISLTGLLGLASDALGGLFTTDALSASAGAGVAGTIFDFGARRANVAISEAQRDAALAEYERTIQVAFREVADALAVQGTIGERVRAIRANREAAQDTAQLEELRYRGGITSFLANLDAQRSLYSARRVQVATELALVLNRVELYRVVAADPTLGAEGSQPAQS